MKETRPKTERLHCIARDRRLATVQQEEEGAEGGEPVVRTQTVEMDDAVMGGKQSSLFAWTSRADRVVEMDSATRNVVRVRARLPFGPRSASLFLPSVSVSVRAFRIIPF